MLNQASYLDRSTHYYLLLIRSNCECYDRSNEQLFLASVVCRDISVQRTGYWLGRIAAGRFGILSMTFEVRTGKAKLFLPFTYSTFSLVDLGSVVCVYYFYWTWTSWIGSWMALLRSSHNSSCKASCFYIVTLLDLYSRFVDHPVLLKKANDRFIIKQYATACLSILHHTQSRCMERQGEMHS